MTENEALQEAIESIDIEMSESYEGDELDDPDVQLWMKKKSDAINLLRSMIT